MSQLLEYILQYNYVIMNLFWYIDICIAFVNRVPVPYEIIIIIIITVDVFVILHVPY